MGQSHRERYHELRNGERKGADGKPEAALSGSQRRGKKRKPSPAEPSDATTQPLPIPGVAPRTREEMLAEIAELERKLKLATHLAAQQLAGQV